MKKLVLVLGLVLLSACGKDGLNGKDGTSGTVGAIGVSGIAGTNAASCTVTQGVHDVEITCPDGSFESIPEAYTVQLCPNPTVYPSTFSEIGYCLAGNLYGTYSANGGFSTLLPPGAYSSNGINSSCSFTVAANCVVAND